MNAKGALLIKMIEPSSGRVELFVPGVLAAELTSSRAISNLISELRIEIATRQKRCVRERDGKWLRCSFRAHQVTSIKSYEWVDQAAGVTPQR
ncbi:hypothetical protein [Pseudomonas fluorescens]|uniref:hypothetical protein n=1 Tax=Pseudomonas fluorescens TaxID=294 RepID=UPI0029667AEC|nr:hypothetical protein [Pseudomonas fluorescens]